MVTSDTADRLEFQPGQGLEILPDRAAHVPAGSDNALVTSPPSAGRRPCAC